MIYLLLKEFNMDIRNSTLCELKPEDIADNKDLLFTIVKNPQFVCGNCARSAAEEKTFVILKPSGSTLLVLFQSQYLLFI